MNHYASWSWLNRRLSGLLCPEYSRRITYFLTRYHRVHNSYGRAAIRLDGRELVCFSWVEAYRQEADQHEIWRRTGRWPERAETPALKRKWDRDGTYSDMDFLASALEFLQTPIQRALESDDCILRILAALDRRVGRRRLARLAEREETLALPPWVRQFYDLRLNPAPPPAG